MSVVANIALNLDARGVPQKLNEVQRSAQATEKAFSALSSAVAAFGTGFALTRVISDVRELDTNLRRLGTVGGDVKALDKGLGALSDRLGGVANKAELAAASYQALSAGFTQTSDNLKLVEAATKAAVGGLVDVTSVVEVTTKTLNAYGMSGAQAVKVTDSITKAIEYGQVQWSDYTSQLGRVASIAAIAGVSLDEVNAFIAAATKNGATAEIAFTGLGATLNTLLQPTKESQEAAKTLGIQWNLAGLQGKGFSGLMAELAQKTGTNQEAAVRLLGSQEAMRGAFAAAAKGGKDYQMILEGLGGAAGKTEADFNTMKGSLENTLKALDTSFKNLSEALGKAFGPTVVIVIQDLTKAINGFASFMSMVPQPVMNTVGAVVKLIAQMILLQKAVQTIIALRAGFVGAMLGMAGATVATGAAAKTTSSAFALYTANTKTLEAASATAATKASGLLGVLRGLAAIGVITIGINLIVTGLQEAMAAAAETRRLRGERAAGGAAAIFGGSATKGQKATAANTLRAIRKEQQIYQQPGTIAAQTLLGPAAQIFGIPTTAQAGARRTVLGERALRAQAVMGLPTRVEEAKGGGGGGGGAADGGAGKEDKKAAKERAQLEARIRGIRMETESTKQLSFIRGKIAQAEIAGDQQLAIRLQGEERNQQILQQYQKSLEGVTSEREKQALFSNAQSQIEASGIQTAAELERLQADRTKAIEEAMTDIANQIALEGQLTEEGRRQVEIEQKVQEFKKANKGVTDAQVAAYRLANQELDKTQKKAKAIKAEQQALDALYGGISSQIANGVGGAIDAVTSSTENLGQALANIGQEILQAVSKMLIFYALAQAFGALGGKDGKGIFSHLARAFGGDPTALGFAEGGFVTGPTNALIGEGGESEYVIPASKMRGAMARYASGARGSAVIPSGGDTGGDMGGVAVASGATVDVRYTVERINSVDYVTADQFQRGMAQAAQQGANQGEQRALRALQNNRSTRSRLGLR